MIKALIFDLGKVIIPFDFQRAYQQLAPMCGYDPADIPGKLSTHDIVQRFESGAMEPKEFVREMGSILGFEFEYDDFCRIFGSIFMPDTLIPESMIASLRQRYRLVLLSNTNAIHFEFLEREYPILRHFHQHVLSHRVGALKPAPAMYHAALEAAQTPPAECFYTDDIPAYVEAAKTHGIDAVVFENREQIERELRSRNVEW